MQKGGGQPRARNSLAAWVARFLGHLFRKEEKPYDPYVAKQLNRDVEESLREK